MMEKTSLGSFQKKVRKKFADSKLKCNFASEIHYKRLKRSLNDDICINSMVVA